MATASRRQHVAHATKGEDLLKAASALDNPARRAQLQESPSTIHRNLENVTGIIGAHDLVHWRQALTVTQTSLITPPPPMHPAKYPPTPCSRHI